MAIGDAAQDWAETASTIPGAAGHPLFPEVAGFASLAATFAGDFERAEARVAAAGNAAAAAGEFNSSVFRALASLAIYQGDLDRARRHAGTWVEIARASGDPYELAHALLPLAGAYPADREVAILLLDEAIEAARIGHVANALSIALPFLAGLLPEEDSARALALLDEAIEVSTSLGDRLGVSLVTGAKGGIAYRHGEWRTALSAAVEMAQQKVELGDQSTMCIPFYLGGLSLYELGRPEPAAVIIGRAEGFSDYYLMTDPVTDIQREGEVALGRVRNQAGFASLAARGAALEPRDAADYLRTEAAAVLAET